MGIAKGDVPIIPDAEEAEDVTVMVQELLEGVLLLIRSQWLHGVVELSRSQPVDQ